MKYFLFTSLSLLFPSNFHYQFLYLLCSLNMPKDLLGNTRNMKILQLKQCNLSYDSISND